MAISLSIASSAAAQVTSLMNDVLKSTTAEWTDAFAKLGKRYGAPRLIVFGQPRGHPARGSGYSNGLIVIDSGQIDDIRSVFVDEGETLAALVGAHEVAHHVQRLLKLSPHEHSSIDKERELQADCAAGWWLGRANGRFLRKTGHPKYPVSNLAQTLPRFYAALAVLDGQVGVRGLPAPVKGHGMPQERANAVLNGLEASNFSECGISGSPL